MSRMSLALFVAFVLLPAAATAQTVDEVIAHYVQARGGMSTMKSVKTLRMTAKLQAGFFQATVQEVNKRPDKVRQDVILQGMDQTRAYDGKGGWQLNPFEGRREAELLSEDDTKDLQVEADIDGPFVDYQEKGNKAELAGHDSVEGTDCYKVKVTLKNGDIRYYYLDTDSYMELKVEAQTIIRGAVQENESYYGDYEQVQGLYFPFTIESGRKGEPDRVKITVQKIEVNVPVDDALFTMPAAKPAAKPASGR